MLILHPFSLQMAFTHKVQPPFVVKLVRWDSPEGALALSIRLQVFVEEQQIPEQEEVDHFDPYAFHVLASDAQRKPCGTGRLYADPEDPTCGHIGRLAVLPEARGKGCASAIMNALLKKARQHGFRRLLLSSQTYATRLYENFGFETSGEPYLDVGIPHIDMELLLD